MITFFSLLIHRFKLIFSLKRNALVLIFMIGFPLVISYIVSNENGPIAKIPIVIVDQDKSEYSTIVIERLMESDSLHITELPTKEDALSLIKQEKAALVFIFKQGFMENIHAGDNEKLITVIRAPAVISSGLVNEIVASEINRISSNVASAQYVVNKYQQFGLDLPENLWQDAWEYTDRQWEPVPLITMDYYELGSYTKQELDVMEKIKSNNKFTYTLGVVITFFMLFIFITNQSFVYEKNNGTILRISFSNIKPQTYFFISSLSITLIALTLFLPSALYMFVSYKLSIYFFIKLVVYTLLLFVSFAIISLLVTTVIKSVKVYHLTMVFLALCFTIFGGAFFAISDLSLRFAKLAMLTPQHWFFSAIRSLVENQPFHTYFLPTITLTSISLLFYFFTYLSLEVKYD